MRALLLAAGFGTRLRPLTETIPKCLAPINGRPLLDYWLETLLDHGVDEVLINTHYLSSKVEEFVKGSSRRGRIKTVHENSLLGTAGTIVHNRGFFKDQPFLVAHADNLTIFSLEDFMRSHECRPSGTKMSMMLFETDNPSACGIVELSDEGTVKAFHEKVIDPPGNLANAAVYILEPSAVDLIASIGKDQVDFSIDVIPRMMGEISVYYNRKYHIDIGTPESLERANRDMRARAFDRYF